MSQRRLTPSASTAVWLLLAVGLFLVVGSDEALGRAGGGNRFPGGGSGGGGGGDGDGLVGIFLWLLVFAIETPLIGVPLLVLFCVATYFGGKTAKRGHESRTIRRGLDADASFRERNTAARLANHDPQFDEARFLGRVKQAFLLLQKSWCAHDLDPIRRFVSDGLYARFELQLEEQRMLGYRDRMDAINIERVWMVGVQIEGPFEVLTVRIRANAVDYRVDLLGGMPLETPGAPETFVEYWSFVRRKGSKSVQGDGLIEGNCPNCGAGIEKVQWSHCAYCDALLRSGEHDWVLMEITQASLWAARDYAPPPGVGPLMGRDPGFGLQHLEDRTSLLFWHWRTAVLHGDTKHLGGAFTDRATADVAADIADDVDEKGFRMYTGEAAVGSVDVAGVLSDDNVDRALVEVVWSGTGIVRSPKGEFERGFPRPARATLFVLVRPFGAQSGLDDAFSSDHCAGCGAPEAIDDGGTCTYCGQATDGGHAGWSVERVLPALSEEGRALRRNLTHAPPPEPVDNPLAVFSDEPLVKAELLSWMAQVAAVDGVVAPKERASLDAVAEKAGVKRTDLERMLRSSSARQEAERLGPRDAKEARLWLAAAARTALADGRVSAAEQDLLERLGQRHGLLPADVRLVVNGERRRLYQDAKRALRRR